MVEHSPDTRKVIGSIPITPIIVLYTSKGSEDMKYFSPGDLVVVYEKAIVEYVGKCSDNNTQHVVRHKKCNYVVEERNIRGKVSRDEKLAFMRTICGF